MLNCHILRFDSLGHIYRCYNRILFSECTSCVAWTVWCVKYSCPYNIHLCSQWVLTSAHGQLASMYILTNRLKSNITGNKNNVTNERDYIIYLHICILANPDNYNSNLRQPEDCMEMYSSGKWNDQTCTESRAYLCGLKEGECRPPPPHTLLLS